MALVLYLTVISTQLSISVATLCNSTEYELNIEQKLKNGLNDKYSMIKGRLVWLKNFSMYYNNPSGIYGSYFIPFSSEEDESNYSPDVLLHAHDAMIFAGCTPPLSKYYSIVSYLYYRFNTNVTNQNNKTKDLSQAWVFGSLGTSLNHLLINTTIANTTFNSLTTVVHTGDNMTFTDIYNILYDGKHNDINLQIVPNDYFNFAPYTVNRHNFATVPFTFDSFMPIWRIALPVNEKDYIQYINTNQTVFYLKYDVSAANIDSNKPYSPYSNQTSEPYSPYLFNETANYYDDFTEYIYDLIKYMSSTYNYSVINTISFFHSTYDGGYYCINNSKPCVGDNRDAIYWHTIPNTFNLTDDDYYMVVGVNSYNLNLTVYQNICYYVQHSDVKGQSSTSALTNFEYNRTVIDLDIPTNVNKSSLKNFWLIQYSRPNNFNPNMMGFNISYQELNSTELLTFQIRDYLNPLTKGSPDIFDLLPPVLIQFSTK